MAISKAVVSVTVEDVFSKGFVSVHEDDTLSSCLSLFGKEKMPALAVLNSKGKLTGVLALRWIIRSRVDPSKTKVKVLTRPAPKVTLNDPICRVARLMIESDIRKLPVQSGERLLGFVSEEDVIRGAVAGGWGTTEVKEIMTKNPFVVDEDDSVGSVLSLFREQGFSHAPVVSDGKLVGVISIRDIIEHVFQPRQRQTLGEIVGDKAKSLGVPVKGIMSKPAITVLLENRLRDAVERMRGSDISSLVVAGNGRPVGMVTKRDFLEAIAQMERVERRLTIQLSLKDTAMDGIQRSSIVDDFESFGRRCEEFLEAGTLFVYMKPSGTNFAGNQLIHCRLQLRTRRGSFFSTSEGWDIGNTFRRALDRLERQILRSKELEYNPKFARTYLQRIRFPLTEL